MTTTYTRALYWQRIHRTGKVIRHMWYNSIIFMHTFFFCNVYVYFCKRLKRLIHSRTISLQCYTHENFIAYAERCYMYTRVLGTSCLYSVRNTFLQHLTDTTNVKRMVITQYARDLRSNYHSHSACYTG